MSLLNFDANAALERARKRHIRPTLPTLSNQDGSDGTGLGALGRLGTVAGEFENAKAADLALDHHEERLKAERHTAIEAGLAPSLFDRWRARADDPRKSGIQCSKCSMSSAHPGPATANPICTE